MLCYVMLCYADMFSRNPANKPDEDDIAESKYINSIIISTVSTSL